MLSQPADHRMGGFRPRRRDRVRLAGGGPRSGSRRSDRLLLHVDSEHVRLECRGKGGAQRHVPESRDGGRSEEAVSHFLLPGRRRPFPGREHPRRRALRRCLSRSVPSSLEAPVLRKIFMLTTNRVGIRRCISDCGVGLQYYRWCGLPSICPPEPGRNSRDEPTAELGHMVSKFHPIAVSPTSQRVL